MMTPFATWLAALMLSWSTPKGRAPELERVEVANRAANALEAVAFDPAEQPMFRGESGRAKTAILLAAIAARESSMRPSVERGVKRGDGGTSWCFMQVNIRKGMRITFARDVDEAKLAPVLFWNAANEYGDTGQDLADDPTKCARYALHIARHSTRTCRDLTYYTSGHCGRGVRASTDRLDLMKSAIKSRAWKDGTGDDVSTAIELVD